MPSLSTSCDSSSLAKVLEHIEARHLCEGVADPSFLDAVDWTLHNAFMDEVPTVNQDGALYMQTCREVDCELLISPPLIRCQPCTKLRERLRHKVERKKAKKSTTSKFTPNICLSTPLKLSKLSDLANEKEASRRKTAMLASRVEALHRTSSCAVDDSTSEGLAK